MEIACKEPPPFLCREILMYLFEKKYQAPQLVKRPGCVLSYLCDWCTQKYMHVWTIATCPATILLSTMRECEHWKAEQKGDISCMRWHTCKLPREFILEWWLPVKKNGMTLYAKVALREKWKIIKWHMKTRLENLTRFYMRYINVIDLNFSTTESILYIYNTTSVYYAY